MYLVLAVAINLFAYYIDITVENNIGSVHVEYKGRQYRALVWSKDLPYDWGGRIPHDIIYSEFLEWVREDTARFRAFFY